MSPIEEGGLRDSVKQALEGQGFVVASDGISLSGGIGANRATQLLSRAGRLGNRGTFIAKFAPVVAEHLPDGSEIDVNSIDPVLVEVVSGTREESIFRWWNLVWWSLPYERAYGRQMRFLVWDRHHDALIGLIGLQSPILSWSPRDTHLGISHKEKDYWVNMSMSAQRLGAVPPYNDLLGGKLVAMAMTTDAVRERFHSKYSGKASRMLGRQLPADLLFITTTGAFGKSSLYNRLKMGSEPVAEFIGYTAGVGTFHIPDGVFAKMIELLKDRGVDVRRGFGTGPSRKMRLVRQAMEILGIKDGHLHGIKRGAYLFPLASNLKPVIANHEAPIFISRPLDQVVSFWKQRWALPRSQRNGSHRAFKSADFISETLKGLNGEKL